VKNDFYRKDPSLPADMRYYGGHPPEILEAGTPWPGGNFVPVSQKTEVAPGLFHPPRRFHHSGHARAEGVVTGHQESARRDPDRGLLASRRRAHPTGDEPLLIRMCTSCLEGCTRSRSPILGRAHCHCAARSVQGRPRRARTLHGRAGVRCPEENFRRSLPCTQGRAQSSSFRVRRLLHQRAVAGDKHNPNL